MTVDRVMVAFKGEGSGTGELSWGQRENWSAITRLKSWLPLGGIKPLPPATTVLEVAEELSWLMSRYQPMRTKLAFGADGQPVQVVHDEGEIELEIVEAGAASPSDIAEAVCERYRDTTLDFETQWPVRMAVVRHEGTLTHMVVLMSHFVTDAAGAMVMISEVTVKEPAPVAGMQPLEQAHWQGSAAGQRQNAAALRYWESILRVIEPRRFPEVPDKPKPRYRRGQFDSPALAIAVRNIADRTRADSAVILLTLYSLALHHVCDADPVVVRPMVGNRFRPGLSGVVCTAAQAGLCVLDIAGVPFDEALSRVAKASMTAYKHAYFDPADVTRLQVTVEEERGLTIDIGCFFNDRRTGVEQTLVKAPSSFAWIMERDDPPLEPLIVDVEDLASALRLTMHMDGHVVSPADGEAILRDMETRAVAQQ